MTKKISKKEKDKRWLELQKTKMHDKMTKHLPVFDGYPVRMPNTTLRYGEEPHEDTYRA